jgi:tetratricopeptide (TPR) repeat protein
LEDGIYRPTGDLSNLSVPASLHALIASRLDSLDPTDRSLLQAASIIGKTFTVDALAAVSGLPADELVGQLRALVRREMLTLEADPRSPERGQYGFVQGLIREVAYGTLAKRDRRRMHVAAARYFESLDDDGIAGALAEHYVAAYKAQPDGPEGAAVAAQARVALRAAADRARSLGSFVQATQFLEQALEVTTDPAEQAQLHGAAGEAGLSAGLLEEPIEHMARSLELTRQTMDRPELMAAIVRYARTVNMSGRTAEAAALLEPARQEYQDLVESPAYIRLAAELARTHLLLGRDAEAIRMIDDVLPIAERLDLTRETIELLVTRGPALANLGRMREGIVTLVGAVSASESYDLVVSGLRARVNLSYAAAGEDPRLAYRVAREGMDLLRRFGLRDWPYMLLNAAGLAIRMGEWDQILPEVEEAALTETHMAARMRRAEIEGLRGKDVDDELQDIADRVAGLTEAQVTVTVDEARASVAFARGDANAALAFAQRSFRQNVAPDSTAVATAVRAAAMLADVAAAREALRALEGLPGRVAQTTAREADAVIAVLEGRTNEGIAGFVDAIRRWRDLGLEFEGALCAMTFVTMVGTTDPEAREAGERAHLVFERVGANMHQVLLDEAIGTAPSVTRTRRDAQIAEDAATSLTRAE